MRIHALPIALAAVALTPSAASAAALQASFEHSPAAPAPGQVVTLTATTPNETSSPIRHTWDLDGDGQFDDATGDSAQTSFGAAGQYTVRLKAERPTTAGTETSVAERQITVGTPSTPTPTPTATTSPTATATTTATATPGANQPPVARFDRKCSTTAAGLVLCAALTVREDELVTLDGRTSTDPDGQIVRYEWDLDGNGTFERDMGSTGVIGHRFDRKDTLADDGRQTVSLRVTDDDGATAVDTFEITIEDARCKSLIAFQDDLRIQGACLVKRRADVAGVPVNRVTSEGPVLLNGMSIVPAGGRTVTIDLPRHRGLLSGPPHVFTSSAKVLMPAGGALVELRDGAVNYRVRDGRLEGFKIDSDAKLNGLRIGGSPALPAVQHGTTQMAITVQMPKEFGRVTSREPIELTAGGPVTRAARPLSFGVDNAPLGPLGLGGLTVTYDGINLWRVDASVALPAPADVGVEGDASILSDGGFAGAGGQLDFGSGIEIGGPIPIFLKSIHFRVNLEPIENECTPNIGVKPNPNPMSVIYGAPAEIDYGIPTFAMCGGIRLTGGPTVPVIDEAAVAVDGKLGFATFEDRPWNFRARGDMEIAGIPMADAGLYVTGGGYVLAYGEYSWGIEDVFHLGGHGRFEFGRKKFNAEAGGRACIDVFDLCRGFDGIISSKGVAVCFSIDVLVDDWEPGLGYEWGDYFITPYFASCDVGDYRVHIKHTRAAAMLRGSAAETIRLPGGLRGAVVAATGTTTPPEFTLVGPNGERIETAGEGPWIERPGVVIAKDARTNITQVAFSTPAGGGWTVEPAAGSSPIMELRSAQGLDEPEIEARVTGKGHHRELTYDITPVEGQSVTFVERSEATGQEIGKATGDKGRIPFAPAVGPAEKRSIVALVTQDGEPRAQIPVAKYAAPPAQRPGKPKRLRVKRSGRTLQFRWAGRADAYRVTTDLTDGRRLMETTTRERLRVRGVGRKLRGRVRVEPISAAGMTGRTARARIR